MAEIREVLQDFPPVEFAFAYGSAVFGQQGYTAEQKRESMTDLIFAVMSQIPHQPQPPPHRHPTATLPPPPLQQHPCAQVRDPHAWHLANLDRHRDHYSAMAVLGPTAITGVGPYAVLVRCPTLYIARHPTVYMLRHCCFSRTQVCKSLAPGSTSIRSCRCVDVCLNMESCPGTQGTTPHRSATPP